MGAPRDLQAEIQHIRDRFFAEPRSYRAELELCDLMDSVLLDAWNGVAQTGDCAVIAVGGYGRRTLHPGSDLDLLIYFDTEIEESLVNKLLMPLWELPFRVGHQVHQAADFEHFEPDLVESYTAFLDARLLFGNSAPAASFRRDRLDPLLRRSHRRFLLALIDLKSMRYGRFNGTVFQLEPDLKNSPGGLRDYHWIRWISWLGSEQSEQALDVDVGLLHIIRNYLHFLSGRDQNVLSYRYQERIAAELGYRDSDRGEAAENFMRDYFLSAQRIANRSSVLESRVLGSPRRLDVIRDLDDADAVIDVFAEAHRNKLEIDPEVLSGIGDRVRALGPEAFVRGEQGRKILALMRDPKGIYKLLHSMHAVGVLGSVFPEFEDIRCRVIRDYFHKYTVDEHSLIAIRNIEELRETSHAPNARRSLSSLLGEIDRPELLLLALLLHDIGKSSHQTEGDHVRSSVERIDGVLERLGLGDMEAGRVRSVIANHLEMSKVMLRRDLEDPDVIAAFADRVGTAQDLRMLCLLTYADMKAVSPEVLTPWKEELLWQLYVDAYDHLKHGFADDRFVNSDDLTSELKSIQQLLPAEVDPESLSTFLDGFPRQYLRNTPADRVAGYYKQYARLTPDVPTVMHWADDGELSEVLVMTEDRPQLFSRITGTLSAFGLNIVRAQAFANSRGIVFDLIAFEDPDRMLERNPTERVRLEETLAGAIAGSIDTGHLLSRKSTSVVFSEKKLELDPKVRFDEGSTKSTILEIVAPDDIGLLYNISRVLADHGCDIEVALVATEGSRAIDVFYLSRHGERLSDDLKCALDSALLEALKPVAQDATTAR